MIITLINPPAVVARYNYSTLSHPPIGLACIASFLRRQGHAVQIIDAVGDGMDRVVNIPEAPGFLMQGISLEAITAAIDPSVRLIGFSCPFTHAWPLVRRLIALVRKTFPHVPLMIGGEHATALPEHCLAEAPLDLVVLGEGEETAAAVADAVASGRPFSGIPGIVFQDAAGRPVRTGRRPRVTSISRLPWPAWDAVSPRPYRVYEGPSAGPVMPMIGSRGCPFACAFCSAPGMWGRRWEAREPGDIVDEMAHYANRFGVREFQFFDISPFIDKTWTEALCREIIGRNLKVTWQAPAGVRAEAIDPETAGLLMASGFTRIQFALESGSPAVLKSMNKTIDIPRFEAAVAAALSAGMGVCVLFIIGYPGETLSDIRQTYRMIRRLAAGGVDEIALSSFVPLPGTAVFSQLREKGALRVDDGYCFEMAGATSLAHVTSWNPGFSGRRLLALKWLGLLQFYAVSFALFPSRALRTVRNLVRGVQESKTDRALAEILKKITLLLTGKHRRS
ncbi:MAG: B12-binding domain-containing radical SAM protein [Thermodesulfobacteriota bacterium]